MMIISNEKIINFYELLNNSFQDNKKYFPAKILFTIRKNIQTLQQLTDDIYIIRNNIIQHYGFLEDSQNEIYKVPEDVRNIAQKELDDLLEIEQEVNILKLKFKDIEDLEFTSNQMEALMFMIDEEDQAE